MRTAQVYDPKLLERWKSKIDRSTPMPLYYQLKMLIKQDIDAGILHNGDAIATESELSTVLGVSRPTIRQCMAAMVNEGYLTRMKGKGTFVTRPRIEANYIAKHESFPAIIQNEGYEPGIQVLDFSQIEGIPGINDKLDIPDDQPLYRLRRLYTASGEPMLYSESYTQAARFKGLLAYDFAAQSMYTTIGEIYGSPIVVVKREITAINATQRDAEMLDIPKNKAICLVFNVAYDQHDRPTEYSISRYRSDKIKFTNYMKC
ncbi:GntR family transcriptional regulator [Eubacteriales bacterium OttesenSCG-928-N13]|nr:GntR family transcriptional regulator [Eubacteriales bacterium OttesenSCG-928-N13]